MQTSVGIQYAGRDGQGVGADDQGNLYFVPGAVPGDRVLVEFEDRSARYRDAEIVEVLSPSTDRIDPVCSYFQQCGGCDWLNWTYSAQLRTKEQSLAHVLNRSKLNAEKQLPIVAAKNPLGYRTRIQLRRNGNELGFLRRRSNDLISIERCAVAHPSLNREMQILKAESADMGTWQKVELFLEGDRVRRSFDSPHGSQGFSQVNAEQNEVLRRIVSEKVSSTDSRFILELYCGDGNFTETYISGVDSVWGVDLSAPAIEKAIQRTKGRGNFSALVAPVDRFLAARLPPEVRENYDTLILDPPRSGVGKALHTFIHPRLKTILYISCSSITFSQDVKSLSQLGFTFRELQPVDMFPQTKHLELVGTFQRS